jgi:alkylation response protein AidB-like acyl-CoA dehydrogenase
MELTFELTDEQRALRETVADLSARVYAPQARGWDEHRTVLADDERKRLAELDLLGVTLPERYGGSGRPLLDALIIIEELAKGSQVAAFAVFEAATGAARVIDLYGTAEQRSRFLPPVCTGETTIAVAISEVEAGSAATDMQIVGREVGGEIVLNGGKRWSSGAGHAEQYLVYTRLIDERGAAGIGAVLVDRDADGLTFGEQERLMGFHGIASADMYFDDVRVPAENVIIEAGGFRKLFSAFSIERLGNATMSLAIGQGALDRTAAYVQERRQFGKAIVEFQLIQATLADMVIDVEAARLLIYRAAIHAGTGVPVPLEASIAKCYANEMAKRVSDAAIALHGGYGYSLEYEVERLHRDAHGWALAGGTPNMQRLRISSEFLGRRFNQRD